MYIQFIENANQPVGRVCEDEPNIYSLYVGKGSIFSYELAIRNFIMLYANEGDTVYIDYKTKPDIIKILSQYKISLVISCTV